MGGGGGGNSQAPFYGSKVCRGILRVGCNVELAWHRGLAQFQSWGREQDSLTIVEAV